MTVTDMHDVCMHVVCMHVRILLILYVCVCVHAFCVFFDTCQSPCFELGHWGTSICLYNHARRLHFKKTILPITFFRSPNNRHFKPFLSPGGGFIFCTRTRRTAVPEVNQPGH
jgi:hypothetical protein